MPWIRMLVCGDYLYPVDIPMISEGGAAERYMATLERLKLLVEQAETIIPGHGRPLTRESATRLLEEDQTYLSSLQADGAAAPLPAGRRSAAQEKIHRQNVRST
jgi:glyoxylase-like metal-dependent hydrolase (beta-lactamase superfamily II)